MTRRRMDRIMLAALTCLSMIAIACDECVDCMEEKCADLMGYCDDDGDCRCMSDCIGKKGIQGVDGCLGECDLTQRPPLFVPLEQCVATGCPDKDECSVPSGYDPPDPGLDTTPVDTTGIDGLGSGTLPDCGFDDTLPFDPTGAVLQLRSADENVCLRLTRRDDGGGSLANTRWILLDAMVGPLLQVAHVDAPDDLCWYSSHHNFQDIAHIWTGGRRHDVRLNHEGHNGEWTFELHTFELGPLDPDLCAPLPDGTGQVGPVIPLFAVQP